MTKRTLAAALLLILISFGCFAQTKYEDLKELFIWYMEVTMDTVNVLEKSQDTKQIAQALNDYVDATLEFIPQMEQFEEKYPELKEMSDPPKELEETMDRFEEAMGRAAESFAGVMMYADDPDVQKAMARFEELGGI
jgi:hypothetical protein